MTTVVALSLLAGGGWLLALLALSLWWAEHRASLEIGRRTADERRTVSELIHKLALRDTKSEVTIQKISSDFNSTLTKLLIGYQQETPEAKTPSPTYDLNSNTFDTVTEGRTWLPSHELLDDSMNPITGPPLKVTPDGNGGWVE